MPRYRVTVRVRTGWPVSASGLWDLRAAGRRLPAPIRLSRTICHVEGYLELTMRSRKLTAMGVIHAIRLLLPMLGMRRDQLERIDVRRIHPIPARRILLATWPPPPPVVPLTHRPGGQPLPLSA